MASTKDRLKELENRVQVLEVEVLRLRCALDNKGLRARPSAMTITETVESDEFLKDGALNEPVSGPMLTQAGSPEKDRLPKNTLHKKPSFFDRIKDRESLIGKYFVGALASLLILIAAASFIAIVWNQISSEVKLGAVGGAGIILTAIGLVMTLRKANSISPILLGTGIGLVYLTIMSANLVFNMIPYEVSALLCVVWTLIVLLSHRYTRLAFTLIIGALGSSINLYFSILYVKNAEDVLLIIAYTSAISLMLILISRELDKWRHLISIFFSYFQFFYIFWATVRYFQLSLSYVQSLIVLLMVLITNYLYYYCDREHIDRWFYLPAGLTTLALFGNMLFMFSITQALPAALRIGIVFVVLLTQFVLNHILYPRIERELSLFYTLPLYLTVIAFGNDVIHVYWMGAWPVVLLFLLRKILWKKPVFIAYMLALIFLDFGNSREGTILSLAFVLMDLILFFYLLYAEKIQDFRLRTFAIFVLFLGYYRLFYNLCELTQLSYRIFRIENVLAYTASVISLFVSYKLGYLRSGDEEKSPFQRDRGIYLLSLLLYAYGMFEMIWVDTALLRFVVVLVTLSVALVQSRLLLSDFDVVPRHIGAWLVLKYFIFTWGVINAFLELPVDSVVYSVAGLLLAVAAIYVGFKLSVKVIRQMGLSITMLMVVKFILADLQGENTMVRVLAFAAGGVLCFLISVIYNRLSQD